MKTIMLMLPFLLFFQQDNAVKEGRYENLVSSDPVYGIEVSKNGSEIHFFLKDAEDNDVKDWKNYGYGNITLIKGRYYITDINSPERDNAKKGKVEVKLHGNTLEFRSFELANALIDGVTVTSNKMYFTLNGTK